jgi:hypothetical protein
MLDSALAIVRNQLALPATNLIKNGNFTTNTLSWSKLFCTLTSVDGVAEMTDQTNSDGLSRAHQVYGVPIGHKIYARADVKATTNLAGIGIPTAQRLASHTGNGEWEKLSFIRTAASASENVIALIDNRTSDWDTVYFDNVFVVDLTATFGAGNEPTKTEMNALMAYFPNSWFGGTRNISPALAVLMLNKLRNLETLVTALGGA